MMIRRVWLYTSFWRCGSRGCGRLRTLFLWWIWGTVGSWVSWWSFRFQGWRRRVGEYCCFRWSISPFLLPSDLASSLISTSFSSEAWFLLLFCSFGLCRSTRTPLQLRLFTIGNVWALQSNPSFESPPGSWGCASAPRWSCLVWVRGFDGGGWVLWGTRPCVGNGARWHLRWLC